MLYTRCLSPHSCLSTLFTYLYWQGLWSPAISREIIQENSIPPVLKSIFYGHWGLPGWLLYLTNLTVVKQLIV